MPAYHFWLECPGCGKATQTIEVQDTRPTPHLKCGDCLMDRVEIVELKVIKWQEDETAP